jgi:hypothetical protein
MNAYIGVKVGWSLAIHWCNLYAFDLASNLVDFLKLTFHRQQALSTLTPTDGHLFRYVRYFFSLGFSPPFLFALTVIPYWTKSITLLGVRELHELAVRVSNKIITYLAIVTTFKAVKRDLVLLAHNAVAEALRPVFLSRTTGSLVEHLPI